MPPTACQRVGCPGLVLVGPSVVADDPPQPVRLGEGDAVAGAHERCAAAQTAESRGGRAGLRTARSYSLWLPPLYGGSHGAKPGLGWCSEFGRSARARR